MPQIQQLQGYATPLEQLSPYINQAINQLGQGFNQGMTNRRDQSILQQLQSAQTPMEQWSLVGQLSPEKAKTVAAMSTPFYTAQGRAAMKSMPSAKDIMTKEKETAKYQGQIEAVDYLRERIPYTGSVVIPGTKSFLGKGTPGLFFHPSAVTKRAEFQTGIAPIMSFLKDLDTRGNLPMGLFNKLMERLPDADLPEAENEGRLNSIEQAIKSYAPDYVKEAIKTQSSKPEFTSEKKRPSLGDIFK
jgi:hypothetical protein